MAAAADITYDVNQTIGTTGSVTGTITTDGTIGTLTTNSFTGVSNYVDYNLTATLGSDTASLQQSIVGTVPSGFGNAVTATPTELLFNFSAPGNPTLTFFGSPFTGVLQPCQPLWSLRNGGIACNGASASSSLQLVNGGPIATMALTGNQVIGTVAPEPMPEIPLPATLPLFASGLGALGLLGRRKKRRALAAA